MLETEDDADLTLVVPLNSSPNVDLAASAVGMALPPLFGGVHFL